MRITEAEMRHAGELTQKCDSWTNKEIALVIKANKLVIAYLESKGIRWQLALTPLRSELESFQGFVDARKRFRR